MAINWITVIAQISNFLILIWLMKRFLYKPILNAMAERQKHLAETEATLRQKEEQAEKRLQEYHEKTENLEQEKLEILAQSYREADEERRQLVSNSRREVEIMKNGWEDALRMEQAAFLQEGRILVGQEAIRIARTVLRDLAGEELEGLMVRRFVGKIAELSPPEIDQLQSGIRQDQNRIIIRSAFVINPHDRRELEEMLRSRLGAEAEIGFEANQQLLAGIEADAGGYHLGWSAEEYLHELDEKLKKYFAENVREG